jgi:hypothetical protein
VEEGILAAFDEGVARLAQVIAGAAACERGWRERVRAALVASLEFFDSEPSWGRFLLLEPSVATIAIAERRQDALRALADLLEREIHGTAADSERFTLPPRLTGELVVGGVLAAVRGRLAEHREHRCAALAPSLMSFVLTSYATVDAGPELGLPVRTTYRTTRVLDAIADRPRSNNREIADAAGLRDEGQTSKLLSRLEQRGLIENVGLGAAYGEPNEWLLTSAGRRVLSTTRRRSAADARSSCRPVGGAA